MIRCGDITSEGVVRAHIDRTKEVNPVLNAMVQDRFDVALEEARNADNRIRRAKEDEPLPPFLGVPCSIKEAFALVGMPNTSGLVSRVGVQVSEDATTVARLRAAGAIPIGVSNLSELCMWIESNNRVYGRTRNPYDLSRTVGGSSGGEGALVGAGASPFGLGADIGGSIRLPAFFNGVFGHKPTGGMVPSTGQYPISENEALRYLCSGPLCRRAEDLMPLLQILAGPDGMDSICTPWELGDVDAVSIRDLTVWVPSDYKGMGSSTELTDAVETVAQRLEKLGARRQEVCLHEFRWAPAMWGALMHEAQEKSFADLLCDEEDFSLFFEAARWCTGRSPHTLPALGLVGLERMSFLATSLIPKMVKRLQRLRTEIHGMLGSNGILLYPPYARPAPRHGVPLLSPTKWRFTGIFNILLLPVTQVPIGLNRKGLPLGVQVAAGMGMDHVSIAVARELEREFGGWVPPEVKGTSKD